MRPPPLQNSPYEKYTKRFFIRASRGKRNYLTSNLSKLPWVWNKKLDPTHSTSNQLIKTVNNSFLPIRFPSSLSISISKEDENKFKKLFLINSNSLLKPLGKHLKPLNKRSIGRNTFMLAYSKEDLIEEFIKISLLRQITKKITKKFDQLNLNDEYLTRIRM